MQPAQQDRLKKLIETSTILSSTEKAEWLNMLAIMNDKQSLELESILKVEAANVHNIKPPLPGSIPVNLPVTNQVLQKPQSAPPLSHISNLPSNIATAQRPVQPSRNEIIPPAIPKPLPVSKPATQVSANRSVSPVSEKHLLTKPGLANRPPAIPVSPPIHASAIHNSRESIQRVSRVDMPATKPMESVRSAPQKPIAPVSAPIQRPQPTPPPIKRRVTVQLETIDDAGKLTVDGMRSIKPSDLLLRLQQLAALEGYFNLLSFLEGSPLYRSYIATGKKMLSSADGAAEQEGSVLQQVTMTKEEFEIFADILRKIQINA